MFLSVVVFRSLSVLLLALWLHFTRWFFARVLRSWSSLFSALRALFLRAVTLPAVSVLRLLSMAMFWMGLPSTTVHRRRVVCHTVAPSGLPFWASWSDFPWSNFRNFNTAASLGVSIPVVPLAPLIPRQALRVVARIRSPLLPFLILISPLSLISDSSSWRGRLLAGTTYVPPENWFECGCSAMKAFAMNHLDHHVARL